MQDDPQPDAELSLIGPGHTHYSGLFTADTESAAANLAFDWYWEMVKGKPGSFLRQPPFAAQKDDGTAWEATIRFSIPNAPPQPTLGQLESKEGATNG